MKPAGIPLVLCGSCGDVASGENAFRILSPMPATYAAEKDEGVKLDLAPDDGAYWFADGVYLGKDPAPQIFAPGMHRVEAVRVSDSAADAVEFTVVRKK